MTETGRDIDGRVVRLGMAGSRARGRVGSAGTRHSMSQVYEGTDSVSSSEEAGVKTNRQNQNS
jgi:hypothetical protein